SASAWFTRPATRLPRSAASSPPFAKSRPPPRDVPSSGNARTAPVEVRSGRASALPLEPLVEAAPRHTEAQGRPADVSPLGGERAGERAPHDLLEPWAARVCLPCTVRRSGIEPKVLEVDRLPAGDDNGPLQHAPELAHVAGPIVPDERFAGRGREVLRLSARASGMGQQMLGHRGNVLTPVAQRRHAQGKG